MLVIFDCDGVLVDSEIHVNKTFVRELSKLGINITPEQALKEFTGLSAQKIYILLEQQYKRSFRDQEIAAIQNRIQEDLATNVKAIHGTEITLKSLQNLRIPYCIASSGSLERIHTVLKASGLFPHFKKETIFSASMVSQGKPAPDLFLYVAQRMQTLPVSCWVVEDSTAGISAAKAARMNNIAFLGAGHTKHDWYKENILKEKPMRVCERMEDVQTILQERLFKYWEASDMVAALPIYRPKASSWV